MIDLVRLIKIYWAEDLHSGGVSGGVLKPPKGLGLLE